jgi:starvation-inducible outer membrane lipoprotein
LPVHSLAAPLLALELQGRVLTDAQGQLSPCDPGRQLASAQFRLL